MFSFVGICFTSDAANETRKAIYCNNSQTNRRSKKVVYLVECW